MIEFSKFPKELYLKDGTKVLLRPSAAKDRDALLKFFETVPEEEAVYLREDPGDKSSIERRADPPDRDGEFTVLARARGRIVAYVTLRRTRDGWMDHLGVARVFVDRKFRNIGLGSQMIGAVVSIAPEVGLEKLIVDIPEFNAPAIQAYAKTGFSRVAEVPGLAKNVEGQDVDVVIMMAELNAPEDTLGLKPW